MKKYHLLFLIQVNVLIGKVWPRLWMQLLILALFMCVYSNVFAAPGCQNSLTSASAPFGSVPSINMGTSTLSTSVTDAGIQCGGSLLTIFRSNGHIKATVTTANNGLLRLGEYSIPYQIYADPNYTYQINPGTTFDYYNFTLLDMLGLTGNAYASVPMYYRIPAAMYTLIAGTYTDTLTINWSWNICTLISIGNICIGPRNTGSTTTVINLSLIISNDCIITAPNINFGSAPLVSSFSPVTQTISITCTLGTPYTVGINNGSNADSNGQRRLANGNNYINYEIYQGTSGTTRWGSIFGQTRASSGADINPGKGLGITPQGFIYNTVILPGQTTPPAGTYADTLLINVTF